MQALRRHRRRLAAVAATLFLAVWGNMALAPCLMAAEALLDGDCPHCPEPPPPCHEPAGSGHCSYIDGYDFDGRSPVVPKVDVQPVAAPAPEYDLAAVPLVRHGPPAHAVRAPPDPGGPRLHLRHCVLND